jgi:ABC-type uncharacterized transport system involved in gliding motility auxiliary subunit
MPYNDPQAIIRAQEETMRRVRQDAAQAQALSEMGSNICLFILALIGAVVLLMI